MRKRAQSIVPWLSFLAGSRRSYLNIAPRSFRVFAVLPSSLVGVSARVFVLRDERIVVGVASIRLGLTNNPRFSSVSKAPADGLATSSCVEAGQKVNLHVENTTGARARAPQLFRNSHSRSWELIRN